jgi:hypothetical protein
MTKSNTKTKVKDRENSLAEKLSQVPVQSDDVQVQTGLVAQSNVENPITAFEKRSEKREAEMNETQEKYEQIRSNVSEDVSNLFERWEAGEFTSQDFQTVVSIDSLESGVGYSSLIRQLEQAFAAEVAYYRSAEGGFLSIDEARQAAFRPCADVEEAKKELNMMMSVPLERLNFIDLLKLQKIAPRVAEQFWENAKLEGRKEFESGHLAANITFPVKYMKGLWNIARYLGVRESFIDDWDPKGGIEVAMIDMLAQSYFQWQYWLEQTVKRSETREKLEHPEYSQWMAKREKELRAMGYTEGEWARPYVSEQQAIEHAVQMADRFNRMFMRTLRQLRDLRRYSPVTINNPNQVNIAADGGQQVNMSK